MKYHVHFYIPCRVKIEDVEAESQAAAIEKAAAAADFHSFFVGDDTRESAQWDEGAPLGALVDEAEDDDFAKSQYHELPGATAYREDKASANTEPRTVAVCTHCGSEEVLADCFAAWDKDRQEWVVESVFEKGGVCKTCDGDARYEFKPIKVAA